MFLKEQSFILCRKQPKDGFKKPTSSIIRSEKETEMTSEQRYV